MNELPDFSEEYKFQLLDRFGYAVKFEDRILIIDLYNTLKSKFSQLEVDFTLENMLKYCKYTLSDETYSTLKQNPIKHTRDKIKSLRTQINYVSKSGNMNYFEKNGMLDWKAAVEYLGLKCNKESFFRYYVYAPNKKIKAFGKGDEYFKVEDLDLYMEKELINEKN